MTSARSTAFPLARYRSETARAVDRQNSCVGWLMVWKDLEVGLSRTTSVRAGSRQIVDLRLSQFFNISTRTGAKISTRRMATSDFASLVCSRRLIRSRSEQKCQVLEKGNTSP